jgi:hypothetical protein
MSAIDQVVTVLMLALFGAFLVPIGLSMASVEGWVMAEPVLTGASVAVAIVHLGLLIVIAINSDR